MNKLNDLPISSTLSLIPYLKCLSEAGYDNNQIIKNYGLGPNIIQHHNYIPSYTAYGVLKSISQKINSKNIGIDANKIMKLPTFIANIQNLMHSTNSVVDFFLRLSKQQELIGSHFKIWLVVENDTIFVCHHGSFSNSMPLSNQTEYFRTLSIIEVVRFYLGSSWKPHELHLNSTQLPPREILNKTKTGRVFINQNHARIPIARGANETIAILHSNIFNKNIESKLIERLKIVTNIFIQHEELSLSLISDMFGCSKRTLQRTLKAEGVNFRELIKQQKLEKAISLLRQGIPIFEIAHKLGYKDHANFTRSFKSQYGIAPSLYLDNLALMLNQKKP